TRTVPKRPFEFHELATPGNPRETLHVVRKNQSKFFSVRPTLPIGGWLLRSGQDWPVIAGDFSFSLSKKTSQRHPHGPGNERLDAIVELITKHERRYECWRVYSGEELRC